MSALYCGTSGFAYPSWKPEFYPKEVSSKSFLNYYSQRLNAVEINYTFRRLPSASMLENWLTATRPDFCFVLKAPMRITHILKLKNAEEFTRVFLGSVEPLRAQHRLGPILFQLPPSLRCDVALLAGFLKRLPRAYRYAFEFRHASWLDEPVYELLRQHAVALCQAETDTFEVPKVETAPFVYSRLRKSEYSEDERAEIVQSIRPVLQRGLDTFVFFKHEDDPSGAFYAEELLHALRGVGKPASPEERGPVAAAS